MKLSKISEKLSTHFEKGKPLHCFSSLFDAVDSFFLTPKTVTTSGSHVRDAVDMKRIMITVMVALMPALLFGMWNVGYQHFLVTGEGTGFWHCFGYGFLKWLPLAIVTYISGLTIEIIFAQRRGHQVAEGFFVTGFIIPMIMPPDVPLWIVALATAFSVLFAKEVFGGTGYNFLNPALVARAFVFFAYPSVISGDSVWVSGALDAVSGATPLSLALNGSVEQMPSVSEMFVGTIPGSLGETSKIAILLGAIVLLFTQVASWKIMLSVLAGGWITAAAFHLGGLSPLPGWQHLLMGGFLFGAVFMATDPVTAAHTTARKHTYAILVGIRAIVIRGAHKGYPEGMMLAILLMNIFAPLIDYCVVRLTIRRRKVLISRKKIRL
ncbi:MAG: NADH:ubiquinone reductase (Na(+)-transporting) subunit B [Bacteroidales bacterium]|nr:NADH:ubiquinone reductase (Na(+)-transporting) subunit B [Bacteroidales bacterium]